MSLSPRSAPADTTCTPSGSWNSAAYSSRLPPSAITAGSALYSAAMASWPASISSAEQSWVHSASASPAKAAVRTPSRSPRPSAWPTRTVVASAMPNGSMKHSVATFSATWWAAAGTSPSRPISSAVAANSPPSMVTVTPIGRPLRSSSRCAAQRGDSQRANSCRSAKRGLRHRYSANPSACTQNISAVAMPMPAAPSSGRPSRPLVST